MMEDLSSEIWAPVASDVPDERDRTSRRYRYEREIGAPRAGAVLREIGFILVVHAIVVVFVLSVLRAVGVH